MKFVFSRAEVFTNARAKYFFRSDGSKYLRSITAFPDPIFKKSGFEEIRDETKKKGLISEPNPENAEENRRKSFYRARNKLFDLLLCNGQLGYFVTLTIDEKKAERHEYADVIKKLSNLLDNSVRRKGLAYVLVPEFHKDGAVHFHGIMNADALGCVRAVSPHTLRELSTAKGKPIYNLKGYTLGFSTAIPIGENERERNAVAKYVYKYITKTHGEKVGGRYYLSGGALRRPEYECLDLNYFEIPCEPIHLSWGGECKVYKLPEAPEGAQEP